MTSTGLLQIGNDRITVDVAPDAGGRVGQITVEGVPLLIAHEQAHEPSPLAWGSYPMVPWAGRIRHGRFRFDAVDYELPVNFGAHAIHGVGFDTPWTVTEHSGNEIGLELPLPNDTRWPFGGNAGQWIAVDGDTIRFELRAAAGKRAMPASLGWHPWFRKPDRFEFHPQAMYRRDADHIAIDELVAVPPGPWDDCFRNEQPVGLMIDGLDLQITSGCRDWVVYDMPAHATCVEPQSGPPDAFTLRPNRIEPGQALEIWFELRVVTKR